MPVVYNVILKNGQEVAQHSAQDSQQIEKVVRICKSKISADAKDGKMSLAYGNYLFHYVKKDDLVFGCLATEETPRRICFGLLEDMEASYQVADSSSLSGKLRERMDFFNNDKKADKIRNVRGEIDEVREIMSENIDRVMERGERIEILVDKTDNLNQSSLSFRQRSTELRRQMWWKNTKLVVILAAMSILGLYFLIGIACGLPGWSRCTRKPH